MLSVQRSRRGGWACENCAVPEGTPLPFRQPTPHLRVCVRISLSPLGLVPFPLPTHGLRRGLHSDAASRLKSAVELHPNPQQLVLTHSLTCGANEWRRWRDFSAVCSVARSEIRVVTQACEDYCCSCGCGCGGGGWGIGMPGRPGYGIGG